MKRVSWSKLGDRKLLRIDVSGLSKTADIVRVLESAKMKPTVPKHSLLAMTIVDGATIDRDVLDAASDLLDHNRPYVKAAAIVGLKAMQRAAFRMKVRGADKKSLAAFGDEDEAMEWLEERS